MVLSYNEDKSRQMVMANEVNLPEEIHRDAPTAWKKPQTVLITGATGFLGAYLLYEWLCQTSANVYCLVRAKQESEARARLLANMDTYRLDTGAIDLTRIRVVLGDVSQPNLGLADDEYAKLAESVDLIVHSAATVMYFRPYESVKSVNVDGTIHTLRLAAVGAPKHVHYVSSYSVARSLEYVGMEPFPEVPLTGSGTGFVLGYVQSKWVAERLCQCARERNIPVTVYRPGIITGDMHHGVMKDEDFVLRAIQTCLRLGVCPQSDTWVHFTPVDYCAKAMVYCANAEDTDGQVYHLVNPSPITWNDLMKRLEMEHSPFEWMNPNQWWITLSNTIRPENFLAPVFMIDRGMRERAQHWKRWSIMDQSFDTNLTRQRLQSSNIDCPPVDDTMISLYFESSLSSAASL
jgi:thioester reductase-like protein